MRPGPLKSVAGDTPIYLDYHATTPCDPRVLDAMLPFFAGVPGNPSSGLHSAGRRAQAAVAQAREQVALLLGASPAEIFFTSGATESNNLALFGCASALGGRTNRRRLLCSTIEHKSVLEPCKVLAERGFEHHELSVDRTGRVAVGSLEARAGDRPLIVSVIAASNEVGTIQPIAELADAAHGLGALFHTDAAQAVGRIPVDVEAWDVDLLSVSGHKLCGPMGVGALYVRDGARGLPLTPLLYGGGQQHGLRPGTLNVPAVVGLGEACRIAQAEVGTEAVRVAALRDALEERLKEAIPGLTINGLRPERLPGNSSLTFPSGIDAEALLGTVHGVLASVGSACNSGALEPSYVLRAMGIPRDEARATLRLGLGRFTTAAEVSAAAQALTTACRQLCTGARERSIP